MAQRAYDKGLHATASRLWGEAIAADPELADDRTAQHRYSAACSAAMAGCRRGKDDPSPDHAARAKLRRQALEWLRAELFAWSKLGEIRPPQARHLMLEALKNWREDPDLAGIRDDQELDKLQEAERKDWQSLWIDVEALQGRLEAGKP